MSLKAAPCKLSVTDWRCKQRERDRETPTLYTDTHLIVKATDPYTHTEGVRRGGGGGVVVVVVVGGGGIWGLYSERLYYIYILITLSNAKIDTGSVFLL